MGARQPARSGRAAVEIEYFTDPLCPWCWAFEQSWRRLRDALGSRLRYRYRMGGLIADWDHYEDPVHSIHRPAQMAPLWFAVRQTCNVALDERIWLEDPPASSYPACLAVKAAERQSPRAAELLLGRLRQAVMLQRRNIARWDVLQVLAEEVAAQEPGCLDPERFVNDLNGDEAASAFRDDLMQARCRQVGRFPTLVVTPPKGPSALLVGHHPYEVLCRTLEEIVPRLGRFLTGPARQ